MDRTKLTGGEDQLPLRAAVKITVTFESGRIASGSGYMVGRNDVLTVSHLVYNGSDDPVASIQVFPAVVNGVTGYIAFAGTEFGFHEVGSPDGTISIDEIGLDYAVIALADNIGDSTGWFEVGSTGVGGADVYSIDYGSDFGGVEAIFTEGVISFSAPNYMIHSMPKVTGSSGSPIILEGEDLIVGVHSAGESFAARFDSAAVNEIKTWIASNNVLDPDQNEDTANNNEVFGSESAQILLGTDEADQIFARQGNDTVDGGTGDDVIWGGDGDDIISGGDGDDFIGGDNAFYSPNSGSDTIDGGDGTDTAVYNFDREIYELIHLEDGTISISGFDQLTSIERIQFNDVTLRVDLDPETGASVYRLYQAAFNRRPDEDGLLFHVNAFEAGVSLDVLSRDFLNASEFSSVYGEDVTNAVYVGLLYQNILGREGDDNGVTYWMDILSQNDDRAFLLLTFSESGENVELVASAIEGGFTLL